jgi:GalNAc-alpha-(1->4)-GalNAc-alpha-(1->3)-diNAcBac-PP-undecaprenol alpha-1,4-N-acetyl-D-galactosaminyltransferase
VISSLGIGGAERSAVTLAGMFAEEQHEVEILTFEPEGTAAGVAPDGLPLAPGITVRRLDLTGESGSWRRALAANWRRLSVLRGAIADVSPALVISFVHVTNVLTVLALLGTRLPVVVCEESEPSASPRSRIWRLLRWVTYPLAKRLVVHSRGASRWFARLPLIRARVIPNAVSVPEAARDQKPAAREPLVLAVGRLGLEKGFDMLIPAFARATADRPEWRLLILGEGAERTNLETAVAELNLAPRVSLPGICSDPWPVYRRAAIFASSSRHEGFGIALCEAMAAGCAVIATDCPSGPREIVTDGVDGLIAHAGSVDAMARALRRLIEDRGLRTRLAANAPRVAERFRPATVKREWLALLGELNIA